MISLKPITTWLTDLSRRWENRNMKSRCLHGRAMYYGYKCKKCDEWYRRQGVTTSHSNSAARRGAPAGAIDVVSISVNK